ncbi:ADP-ribosylation factor-like protein 6-interacting protein 4 [Harpegnathos saltator]|uniref:ADP-ribosylation factor-like protein 6-interacting protein 4 n=2 Tax=Harpegnathos saltator TaxID=610380 RepID=E2BI88_HARSA|nr:ADP-ribosylation factor-like protein 6-interacting protein 4 [Harpegnathos saltator]
MQKRKKKKKRMRKKLKKKSKKIVPKKKRHSKKKPKEKTGKEDTTNEIASEMAEKAKAMAPMTKEEWEKRQSIVRKVYDKETGRYRLIKGDGEVLEEIVSRDHHREINRQATKGDGEYFQARLKMNAV